MRLGLLTKIFNEPNDNIIKFYLDKILNPDYKLICRILLIFPFSTFEVERLFSLLNLINIKNHKRANLVTETLENLRLLKLNQININGNEIIQKIRNRHKVIKKDATS